MNNRLITAAVGAALLSAAYVPAASAQSSELEQLKAQLQVLTQKVEQLEKEQKAQGEAQDRTTDAVAQARANVGEWVGRFQWKGDFRYRNEDIKQEFNPAERNRDRIRVRAGFVAKVNDTVRTEIQLTTGETLANGGYGDARSPNQTLTDASSRKRVWFDTAFAEWAPNANFKVTFGKMRYPWVRPTGSLFFDGDINPEGGAVNWQQGATGVFATAFYVNLAERSAAADSTMAGAQIGWRGDLASNTRLTLAASYFDHGAVEGYNAVQDATLPGNAFGNTTTASAAICRPGVITATSTACIADDFNIFEVLAELSMQMGGKPLVFSLDYAKNNKADFAASATSPSGLDTAYMGGVQYGRVTTAHTWEVGLLYQKVENDSLYGQWVDSDFGAGSTGSSGWVAKGGYGFGRNFRINGTYFWNDTNIDVPVTIAGAPVTDRKYKRLQLDLNVSF
jgi:outer membrane murein-binding lipoprotein Lpp